MDRYLSQLAAGYSTCLPYYWHGYTAYVHYKVISRSSCQVSTTIVVVCALPSVLVPHKAAIRCITR